MQITGICIRTTYTYVHLKTGQLTIASMQVQSSREEKPEQFTDGPYKAGSYVCSAHKGLPE